MTSIVVVGGPTASGKSALAMQLALERDGEIIGADSRQLYRGLPVASASPSAADLAAVPHHLYGVVEPTTTLTASSFLALCDAAIDDVIGRGKSAIVVGGTGLYLRALRLGLDDALPHDAAVRAKLEDDLARDGLPALVARLRAVDEEAAGAVDVKNPVRVVRALEIALLGGDAGGRSIAGLLQRPPRDRVAAAAWMLVDRADLPERIFSRARQMFEEGVVDEARALRSILPVGHALLGTIGVAEALAFSDGLMDRETAIERVAARTRQYARRQRTWFRKEPWWTVSGAAR